MTSKERCAVWSDSLERSLTNVFYDVASLQYVAATGIPEPQKEHAIIMGKFARDCQNCMHQLTSSLEDLLGAEVLALSFRVGMHSGPITGGVLRGQKARFQVWLKGRRLSWLSSLHFRSLINFTSCSSAALWRYNQYR